MSTTSDSDAALVVEALTNAIAADLEGSIANLGYPVGLGLAPHPDTCKLAAARIVARIGDKALALLAARNAPSQDADIHLLGRSLADIHEDDRERGSDMA